MGKDTFITLFDSNMEDVGRICEESMMRFCEPVIYRGLFDLSIHPSWNKINAILDQFYRARENDWITWIDADCVMTRRFSIAEFGKVTTADIIVPSGIGSGPCLCCIGVRVTPWSKRFLHTLLLAGDVEDNDKYGKGNGPKWEENAFKALINEFPAIRSKVMLSGNEWCVTGVPWERDKELKVPIHHFGAMKNDLRINLMRQAFQGKYG